MIAPRTTFILTALAAASLTSLTAPAAQAATMFGGPSAAPLAARKGTQFATKFDPVQASLEALLVDGYAIVTSSSGDSGAVLILRKDNPTTHTTQWLHCELKGDHNGSVTLSASHAVVSECHALN